MATGKTFEDYDNGPKDRKLCPRCQALPKAGAVNIRLNRMQEDNPSRFDQVASRQISMCEPCTVEVFEELKDKLEEETGGGTRRARTPRHETRPATPAPRRRSRRTRA